MDKIEEMFYDICLILSERIRGMEEKVENLEKEKEIPSKAITEKDIAVTVKKSIYY